MNIAFSASVTAKPPLLVLDACVASDTVEASWEGHALSPPFSAQEKTNCRPKKREYTKGFMVDNPFLLRPYFLRNFTLRFFCVSESFGGSTNLRVVAGTVSVGCCFLITRSTRCCLACFWVCLFLLIVFVKGSVYECFVYVHA